MEKAQAEACGYDLMKAAHPAIPIVTMVDSGILLAMTDRDLLPKAGEPVPPAGPPEAPGRKRRLALALAIAVVSDLLSVWLEFVPPLQWAVDLLTAGLLFLILGRQWLLLPALIAEAIPGLAVLPFWVLVVASIAAWGKIGRG